MDERGEIHSLMPCASCGMMERNLIQALSAVNYKTVSDPTADSSVQSGRSVQTNRGFPSLCRLIVLKWQYGLGANSGPECRKTHYPANEESRKTIECACEPRTRFECVLYTSRTGFYCGLGTTRHENTAPKITRAAFSLLFFFKFFYFCFDIKHYLSQKRIISQVLHLISESLVLRSLWLWMVGWSYKLLTWF